MVILVHLLGRGRLFRAIGLEPECFAFEELALVFGLNRGSETLHKNWQQLTYSTLYATPASMMYT
jgi:hypothetical protein